MGLASWSWGCEFESWHRINLSSCLKRPKIKQKEAILKVTMWRWDGFFRTLHSGVRSVTTSGVAFVTATNPWPRSLGMAGSSPNRSSSFTRFWVRQNNFLSFYVIVLHSRALVMPPTVLPDMVIFCTLGDFLEPLATINLPKSPTFLRQYL